MKKVDFDQRSSAWPVNRINYLLRRRECWRRRFSPFITLNKILESATLLIGAGFFPAGGIGPKFVT